MATMQVQSRGAYRITPPTRKVNLTVVAQKECFRIFLLPDVCVTSRRAYLHRATANKRRTRCRR